MVDISSRRTRILKLCRLGVGAGVAAATVNFMTQKMVVEFCEGADPKQVMQAVLKACRKIEPDCEIDL